MAGATIPIVGPLQPAKIVTATAIQRELVGDVEQPEEITYESDDRAVAALEIMIQVVQLTGAITGFSMCNDIRWQIWSLSHGEATYQIPPNMGQAASIVNPGAQVQFPQWSILARGTLVYVACRAMRLILANTRGNSSALIRASIQPLPNLPGDRIPFPTLDGQPSASGRGFFPFGAREWRVSPVVIGGPVSLVTTYAWSNDDVPFPVRIEPVTQFMDWTPILDLEASWTCDTWIVAEYR